MFQYLWSHSSKKPGPETRSYRKWKTDAITLVVRHRMMRAAARRVYPEYRVCARCDREAVKAVVFRCRVVRVWAACLSGVTEHCIFQGCAKCHSVITQMSP